MGISWTTKFWVGLSLALFVAGCSKTAKIHKRDGTIVEGRISGVDGPSLYVWIEDASSEDDEFEVEIDRDDIVDIDHPGDGTALVGGSASAAVITIFGVYMSTHEKSCNSEDGGCPPDFGPIFAGILCVVALVVSIPATIGGIITYVESKSAIKSKKKYRPKAVPWAMSDGERTYWGIVMSWRW